MNSIQTVRNYRLSSRQLQQKRLQYIVCSERRRASYSPISTIRPCSVYLFRISQNHTILCLLKCPTVQSLLPFCNYCPLHLHFNSFCSQPIATCQWTTAFLLDKSCWPESSNKKPSLKKGYETQVKTLSLKKVMKIIGI